MPNEQSPLSALQQLMQQRGKKKLDVPEGGVINNDTLRKPVANERLARIEEAGRRIQARLRMPGLDPAERAYLEQQLQELHRQWQTASVEAAPTPAPTPRPTPTAAPKGAPAEGSLDDKALQMLMVAAKAKPGR